MWILFSGLIEEMYGWLRDQALSSHMLRFMVSNLTIQLIYVFCAFTNDSPGIVFIFKAQAIGDGFAGGGGTPHSLEKRECQFHQIHFSIWKGNILSPLPQ
jgi:hypothetical protein